MEEIPTQNYTGNVSNPDAPLVVDGYVSPDVLAAQAGEPVDFSKDVLVEEDDIADKA